MRMALFANFIIILLEILGLRNSICSRGWKIFAYYTQISNIITLISSVAFIFFRNAASPLRYTACCLLTMTFLITLFVLVPMGGSFRLLMLQGNGLYHHTLCPIISVVSYCFLEPHGGAVLLPAAVTFFYGIIMLLMNGKGLFDGPYPFFRVRQQSVLATVLWMAVLVGLISLISFVIPV